MLGHLAAVTLATIVAGGILGGAGDLIVFGGVRQGGHLEPSATQAGPIPTAAALAGNAVKTAEPTPAQTSSPAPTVSPTATPAPTAPPLTVIPYRSGGRSYVGLTTRDATATFNAPFAGTVEVRTYQFIDGVVRIGSSVPGLPFFPYVSVATSDRRITYRPGALGAVTDVLVTDGAAVGAGDPLFRLVARDRSSWATFYDTKIDFQVVVSLQSVPGNRDLDAAPLFAGS